MSKLLKALGGLVLLYVLVMGGSGLAIQAMLSGGVGERMREKVQTMLPVEVSIEGGDFDLKEWFFFRPAISFDQLRVGNPPGYGDEPLFQADYVAARADLWSLLDREASIRTVEILAPQLLVESNAEGRTNVQALIDALASQPSTEPSPSPEREDRTTVSIDSFRLDNGTIRYLSPGEEPFAAKNIQIAINDFEPEAPIRLEAALDLFEQEALHLTFDGETGPFTPRSSPTEGTLTVDGLPAKLPERFRSRHLGNFLLAPGPDSRFHITADLAGDLLGVLTGKGEMTFENLELGKPHEPRLPLNGEAPILLTLMDPLAAPGFHLIMPDAELSLGSGKWQGGVEVQYDHGRVRGKSAGSVAGVDVNQMLTAFSDVKNVAYGRMELKRYDLIFEGSSSEEMQQNLKGSGRLELHDGKLALFDVLETIEKFVTLAWTGERKATGVTSFIELATDFSVDDRTIKTPNLVLRNEAAEIAGDGSIRLVDGLRLDYDLSSLVSGLLAERLGGVMSSEGVAQLAVPVRVKGSAKSPSVYVDVKSLAKRQAISQTKSLLGKLLGRKTEEEQPEEGEPVAPQPKPRLPFDLDQIFK